MGIGIVTEKVRFVGKHDELTERIIRIFYQVHNELGYGFLEAVYERAMEVALRQAGLQVNAQMSLPVSFRGEVIGIFRADLVVEGAVILELKVSDDISKMHEGQLLHYLRSCDVEIGLILSFGESPKIRRVQFANDRKKLGAMEA